MAKAKGETERFEQVLVEYEKNPAITRKRLYLEAKEKIYSGVNKIMLESENNTSQFFWPLATMPNQHSSGVKPQNDANLAGENSSEDRVATRKSNPVNELRPSRSRHEP